MKKMYLFFVLLVTAFASKAQTESETVEWIMLKLSSITNCQPELQGKEELTAAYLMIPTATNDFYTRGQIVEKIQIDFSSITTISCKVNACSHIIFSGKNFPVWKYDFTKGWFVKDFSNTGARLLLKNVSQTDLEKLVKAFKHLATLNGAKLVNDDLF